jgi:hypothetical protein
MSLNTIKDALEQICLCRARIRAGRGSLEDAEACIGLYYRDSRL